MCRTGLFCRLLEYGARLRFAAYGAASPRPSDQRLVAERCKAEKAWAAWGRSQ